MIVGDDVGVAVLRLVHLHVGVLPGELLTGIYGLERRGRKGEKEKERERQIVSDKLNRTPAYEFSSRNSRWLGALGVWNPRMQREFNQERFCFYSDPAARTRDPTERGMERPEDLRAPAGAGG